MHISGLDLGAWVTFYMGIMLARSGEPFSKADGSPSDSRRIISYVGYALLVVGVGIFVIALRK